MKFDVEEVLEFWFADSAESDEKFKQRMGTWFTNSDDFDQVVKERFESAVAVAASDEMAHLESDKRGVLALIIVLDQFPRNIYRGTPRAFAYDDKALGLTLKVLRTGIDESMDYLERTFAYMPLQHSEDLKIQDLSIDTFKKLADVAQSPAQVEMAVDSLEYSQLHRDIIQQFGRFPHRNEILGRTSTAKELEYLASDPETFGQVKK